jgi:hypothetical protein
VLFDGTGFDAWSGNEGPVSWELVDGGAMQVVPKAGDIRTKAEFGDCQLHVEWAAPSEIKGEGQGRGNSGVFLQGIYEVQVLDGYDNPTYADGITGGIYGQKPPLVNACSKPGAWHVYDIIFHAARTNEAGYVTAPAIITVLHNGVVIHHAYALQGPTMHKNRTQYDRPPARGPVVLQDHGDLVRFRNIWIRELGDWQAV